MINENNNADKINVIYIIYILLLLLIKKNKQKFFKITQVYNIIIYIQIILCICKKYI